MKIAILGTSNSILKDGWTYGLRASMPEAEIFNFSIGGSPGMQFGWMMAHDFSFYDLVFFDSVPNDEKLAKLIGSVDYSTRITYEIISTIASQTRVIVLGISLVQHALQYSEIYNRRVEIAKICGAQFISLTEISKIYGRSILGQSAPIYEAEAHPNRLIGKVAGFELGRLLPKFILLTPKVSHAKCFKNNFSFLDPTEGAENIVEKSNKLLSAKFLQLYAGEFFAHSNDGLCIGMYVNKYGTRASIDLISQSATKEFNCWYDLTPSLVELSFVPIPNGFSFKKIQVTRKWKLGVSRPINGEQYDYSLPLPQLQLSKLIFWKAGLSFSIPSVEDMSNFDYLLLHKSIITALEGVYKSSDDSGEDIHPEEFTSTYRFEVAARAFEALLQVDIQNIRLLNETANCWIRAKNFVRAEELLSAVVSLQPKVFSSHNSLGQVLFKLGRYRESEFAFRESLQINSNQPLILFELARTLFELKDYSKSLNSLNEALNSKHIPPEAYLLEGRVRTCIHDFNGAINAFKKFVSLSPNSFLGHLHLGRVYGAKKQYELAINSFMRALDIDCASAVAIRDLAKIYLAKGEWAHVCNLLQNLASNRDVDWSILLIYGRGLIGLGFRSEAVEIFKRLIKLRPEDKIVQAGFAEALSISESRNFKPPI